MPLIKEENSLIYSGNRLPKCPHCDREFEPGAHDLYCLYDEGEQTIECPYCEKEFLVETRVSQPISVHPLVAKRIEDLEVERKGYIDRELVLHKIRAEAEDERDRYRATLETVLDLIEPAVGRFSDGEPINAIGHAYNLGRTVVPKP